MQKIDASAGSRVLQGSLRIFLAESLILPTGLLTVVFLTRKLGPESYGLYSIVAVIASWTSWTITSIFNRTTVKFVSEARTWEPVATTALWLYSLAACGAALFLGALASPIAHLLGEPSIARYLLLFALEIPLFALANAHKAVLLGLGRFGSKAVISSSYWIARIFFIIIFVEMGFSVIGAIVGSICAAMFELALSRYFVHPPIFCRTHFPIERFWKYSAPLFLAALSVRIFDRLDLFALKALGGTAAQAGIYAAAQNLTLLPGIFALAFADPLLSILSRLVSAGDHIEAKTIARNALRLVVLLFPLAGIIAGSAGEIVHLFFGSVYASAAPLLSILFFGALWMVVIAVTASILTAGGKPNWTIILTAPMIPLGLCGHILVIPRTGPVGASLVTTVFAMLHGLLALLAVNKHWGVQPPRGTVIRSLAASMLCYSISAFWSISGIWLLPKLLIVAIIGMAALYVLGEFSNDEIELVRAKFRQGVC